MENQFLYRSLTQDLRSLNNLMRTLAATNLIEIYSWLDPRKTFYELDDISSFYVSGEKERMRCMELIIDRLYMILNFNVDYMELTTRPNKKKITKKRGKTEKFNAWTNC
ncbi:hypothetical protein QE152_g27858 [Popillia japonica]|uniref:Uncharacterized protein n=1 Tax=Popillia japonica TaxID=7064 RepID=A0AAW1JK48_POPJA